jgi:hypothetical protein
VPLIGFMYNFTLLGVTPTPILACIVWALATFKNPKVNSNNKKRIMIKKLIY